MAYPEVEINKEHSCVNIHNEDGSFISGHSVEAIVLAKVLFEIEKMAMALEELNGKTR